MKSSINDVDFLDFVNNFDIIFLSETWQKAHDQFDINGYITVPVPRPQSSNSKRGHGGICLFYKSSLQKGISISEIANEGVMWITLDKLFFGFDDNVYICFCYIPPSNSVYFKEHNLGFFEMIESGVRKYQKYGKICIMGDLNARCGERSDLLSDAPNLERYLPIDDNDYMFENHNDIPFRFTMDRTVNHSGGKLLDMCLSTDLRIVNGRLGDDAGTGSYTFMSSKGNSVIDYAIVSYQLFSYIKDFIVHDMLTCSTHCPIEIDLFKKCQTTADKVKFKTIDKIVWDDSKVNSYKESIVQELPNLQQNINDIVNCQEKISDGVNKFASTLYNAAFSTFGQHQRVCVNKEKTKYKCKSQTWYTNECKLAKGVFVSVNRKYRQYRTELNRELLLNSRKRYRRVKRKAKAQYNRNQSKHLQFLARHHPQSFWAELKKVNRKTSKNNTCDISSEEFYNHFKYLYGNRTDYHNVDVENSLLENDVVHIDELDHNFTVDEILAALSTLKRGKSAGLDCIIPEMLIEVKDFLAPILCNLFNYMYSNCIYPESWTKGIIVAVPKKGNLNDVNNYRGITLTCILSKIFSTLLDTRLRKWAEANELLTDFQYGFRKGRSTVDCVFVLTSLIDKIVNHEKRKLYCAFIDFRKAFDLVYRNGIWYKLLHYGASSKLVKMLQKLYESVKSCVRSNGECSNFFDSYMGVKQGEPLSPLLFIFFINDMYESLYDDSIDNISIDEIKMFLLLFADDTVLFSYSKDGLQHLLDNLYLYCNKWGVSVNTGKTVVMVCKRGNVKEDLKLYYDGQLLQNVNKFTYLGITLSCNNTYFQAQKSLSEQSLKACYSLYSLFDNVSLNVTEKIKLFDLMICPVLNYGSEVWGFHKGPNIEKIHLKFLKQLLHVKQSTMDAMVYGELGRVPMILQRKIRIIKYWSKIINNQQSLIYKLYSIQDHSGKYINKWTLNVKRLFDDLGLSYMFENNVINQYDIQVIVKRLYDQYLQRWTENISNSSKAETYYLFKENNTLEIESYLSGIKNVSHRVCMTRFRCSAHNLRIEEGRSRNIDREQRVCTNCNMNVIENEYHFLLVCPLYSKIRKDCLPKYYCHWPCIRKFKQLMNCKQTKLMSAIAKFIFLANKIRL